MAAKRKTNQPAGSSSSRAKPRPATYKQVRQAWHRAKLEAERARYVAETAAWKQVSNSYRGGVPTRTSEMWPVSTGDRFGSLLERWQLGSARDRAYNAFRNNPVARTLVQTETDNVIGDGLNYQPTSDSEEWNREAKDKYYEWLEVASVRGPDFHSGCELQRMLWQRSRVAGDVGWILVARGAESRIQVVPAENIVTPDGMQTDPAVFDGIRFDGQGNPQTYYVMSRMTPGERKFIPIGWRDFVFLPHQSDPHQARGESCFLTIFELLAHLDRYVDGVSLAAWMSTVFGLIFKDATSTKQYAGLPTVSNSQGVQQRALTLENGSVKYIAPEGEVVQVDAKQPMQQTPEFIRTIMRLIGQPFDMPLAVVFKDTSQENFASARIGLLPFYRACRIRAARFGTRWSRTIKWWLSREHYRAKDDPKRWKSAWPENYWSHELRVNAWKYTDPVSEVQGDMLAVDAGYKSPQMVIEEQGGDVAETLRQREEWEKLTANLPKVRSTMTRDAAGEGGTAAGPDPELERIKARADAYGVAVRAGVVTPQTPDEDAFRVELTLPPMSPEAKKAWEEDKGVRRPITLTQPGGQKAAPFGGQGGDGGEEENDGDETPKEMSLVHGGLVKMSGQLSEITGILASRSDDKPSAPPAPPQMPPMTFHFPAQPPANVTVTAPVSVPAAPAPIVNVHVDPPPAPNVTVESPAVNFSPPDVEVNIAAPPPADVRVTIEPPPPAQVNVTTPPVHVVTPPVNVEVAAPPAPPPAEVKVNIEPPPPAQVTVNQPDVNITVEPAQVNLKQPDVTVNVEAAPAPSVTVNPPDVNVTAPDVNVTVQPSQVTVEAPSATAPPAVTVNVTPESTGPADTAVERDDTGRIKRMVETGPGGAKMVKTITRDARGRITGIKRTPAEGGGEA